MGLNVFTKENGKMQIDFQDRIEIEVGNIYINIDCVNDNLQSLKEAKELIENIMCDVIIKQQQDSNHIKKENTLLT